MNKSPIRASNIIAVAVDGSSFGLAALDFRFRREKEMMCPWARWMTNVSTGKAMKRDSFTRSFQMISCTYWWAARKASVKCTVVNGMDVNNVSIRGGSSASSSSSSFSVVVSELLFRGRLFGSRFEICPVDESSRNCVSVAFRSMNWPFGSWVFLFFPSLVLLLPICWFSSCCRSAAISRRVFACRVLLLLVLLENSGGRERGIEDAAKVFSSSATAAAAARRCLRFWGIVCGLNSMNTSILLCVELS